MVENIKANDFSQFTKEEQENFRLVDVRTVEEYEEGHIPKTIHIPHDEMEERYMELEEWKDEKILLICRSGRRSLYAAEILKEKGFQQVYNFEGGMLDWTGEIEK